MFNLMIHDALMAGSKEAIFCNFLISVSKIDVLIGISPQCNKKIPKVCLPQHDFFVIFLCVLKISFELVRPQMSSNDISNQTYKPNVTSYVDLSIFEKIYIFLGGVVNLLSLIQLFAIYSSDPLKTLLHKFIYLL